ncbi:hypothetical protein OPV22_015480 [Ensete ventricosum]|uniref:Uncharacterized protein n=1 Tax=Ensete ventricosum TaxID=4639 RepID=A0AAV8PSX5_ENSVE|nr:hypothetical protein OPV22_015480 [Ensete ventricosum]
MAEHHHHHLIHHHKEANPAEGVYEKHKADKDPEHARRHKMEEEIAAATAVGSGGYAAHERHERKEAKEQAEEAHGKKHHHFF